MRLDRFAKQLEEGVQPVYFLKGDEYQAGKALAMLTALADANEVNVFTPLEKVEDALAALDSFPMFGERRVVVMQDVASFKEEERDALTDYCANPTDTSVLVFYRCGWAPKAAQTVEFDKLKGEDFADSMVAYCREQGIKATPSALSLLLAYCGEDARVVEAELVKLAAYTGGATIDEGAVKAVVTATPEYKIFAFGDFVARGNYVGAHKVLDSLSSGNDTGIFLGNVINHYRRAFYAKVSGLSVPELAKLLGDAKTFTITKALESVRCYSAKTLLALLKTLYRLEYDFKSGRMGPAEALDLAVAEAIERRNT